MPTKQQTDALLALKSVASTTAHVTVWKLTDAPPSSVADWVEMADAPRLRAAIEGQSAVVAASVLEEESTLKSRVKVGFEKIENWASGGTPFRRFKDARVTEWFDELFRSIGRNQDTHLSRNDLFHGHLVFDASVPSAVDVLVVFHAKEYPTDVPGIGAKPVSAARLEPGIPSFRSTDRVYERRNSIYSLRKNVIWNIDFGSASNPYAVFLFPEKPVVLEQEFLGTEVFDVNCFVNEGVRTFLAQGAG